MEFGLAKAKWKVVDCDSQDGEEGHPRKAIDDDPSYLSGTRGFATEVDPMPHHITVDLGEDGDDPWIYLHYLVRTNGMVGLSCERDLR